MSDRSYYIGPWAWDLSAGRGADTTPAEGFWRPPDGTVGALDLRPLNACAQKGGTHARNFGLFAADRQLKAPYAALGTDLDAALDAVQCGAVEQALRVPLAARTLREAIVELFTLRADPDQTRMTAPLGVKRDGTQEIWLAGECIWSKRFEGESDPAWPMVQAKYQRAYRVVRDQALAAKGDVHLRYLSTLAEKCKVDPRLLVPRDLPYEGVRTPQTTLTEDWNCADSDTISCDLTWTEVQNNWKIVSNYCRSDHTTAGWRQCTARAEHDLSSDDHYCQAEVYFLHGYSSYYGGTAVRFNSAANSFYLGYADTLNNKIQIVKMVAGTGTSLADAACSVPASTWLTVKTQVDDTTLDCWVETTHLQTTDSTFSGQTRIGIYSQFEDNKYHLFDDLIAEDLGAPPAPPTNVAASDGTDTAKVVLTWTKSDGATGYKIYRGTSSNPTGLLDTVGDVATYNDASAVPGTQYYYRLKATNAYGDSGYSAEDTGWRKLSAPTSLTASDGTYTTKVQLDWTKATGATGYKIYRGELPNPTDLLDTVGDVATYNDESAVPETVYYYRLKSTCALGDSDYGPDETGWRATEPPTTTAAPPINYTQNFSDGEGMADTLTRLWDALRDETEDEGLTDESARVFDALREEDDGENIGDESARVFDAEREEDDGEGIGDEMDRLVDFSREQAESFGLSDLLSQMTVFSRELKEAESLTDIQAHLSVFDRDMTEAFGLTDSTERLVAFERFLPDGMDITDVMAVSAALEAICLLVKGILRILSVEGGCVKSVLGTVTVSPVEGVM